ncbi:MAG: hypothetical protein NDI58_05790, partial [Geothrix sp.]|nr:hypothetical protein [Geothrix sp.]
MPLDTHQSVFREHLLEHLVLGELLKHSWFNDNAALEISRPAVDRAGYDAVLESNGFTRHIQFKSSAHTAKTSRQNIHVDLSKKPSACVVWTLFDPSDLKLGPFLFFGDVPGGPLPSLDGLPVAKHTKGNAKGVKLERPSLRVLPRTSFIVFDSISDLYASLFGATASTGSIQANSA